MEEPGFEPHLSASRVFRASLRPLRHLVLPILTAIPRTGNIIWITHDGHMALPELTQLLTFVYNLKGTGFADIFSSAEVFLEVKICRKFGAK